ncbi:hypothetical protein EUGRSUZ_L01578 [Eucalyptus grandis]|uniref:Profilin n=1 Tax=Eucalyptus grandis TaxID=71139 RepID=A0A058ZSS7_EUCGR|nr:hypothetical protein EUGRSUZ_L01578 [Eucalyptus grandis]
MEWEVYYEDYLMFKTKSMNEDGTYRAAAIIDHDGKVWTQTSNFPQLTTEERITIMREFDEPGTLTTIGLYLGGTKYVVIGVEPGDAIQAHKVNQLVASRLFIICSHLYLAAGFIPLISNASIPGHDTTAPSIEWLTTGTCRYNSRHPASKGTFHLNIPERRNVIYEIWF